MNFVEIIVKQINELKIPYDELKIVVPNKRAIKFINETLAQSNLKPVFAPEINTIQEWITNNSKERIGEPLELLLELYDVHLKLSKEKSQKFSQFYNWGRQLISDFDEIDRYLVNPKEIYRDLRNVKEIENWSFSEDKLSNRQTEFLEFWLQLKDYYFHFNKRLKKKALTYSGQLFKKMALVPQQLNEKNKFIVFAGFNALSIVEEKIIHYFIEQKQAKIIWDTDKYYWENKNHEAGLFIRKFYKNKKIDIQLPENLKSNPKKIKIYNIPNETLQAIWSANELIKAVNEKTIKNTALILANENLLIPILNNLPNEIGEANITLGIPLKKTGIRTFLYNYFDAKLGFKRFNTKSIYYKYIQQFIQHPFIQLSLNKNEKNELKKLENNLVKSNSSFVNPKNLNFISENLQLIFHLFFNNQTSFEIKIYDDLIKIFKQIHQKLREYKYLVQAEICYLFLKKIIEIEDILKSINFELDLKTIKQLIETQYQNETVSLIGSPTEGLQIMGILESRLLDFENLIIVGMNEGSLPAKNISNSMIPMDIKIHHGLPTPHDKEAIFSNHFYRLMHRSKSVSISYSSDVNTNSEKSRYIRQIEHEFPKINKNIEIEKIIIKTQISGAVSSKQDVMSSKSIQNQLNEIMKRGISPSALNTFRICKKQFYYRYIIGLKEKENIEESIENSTFGTIVHAVLEELYKPFIKKQIFVHDIEQMTKNVEFEVNKQFQLFFPKNAYKKGKNRLSYNTILIMIKKFLKQEIAFISKQNNPIFLLELEKELSIENRFLINGKPKMIKFKGTADRIDQIGNKIRIIDYKTGSCQLKDVDFSNKNMDELLNLNGKYTYPFQLLLYFYMYKKQNPNENNITSGIFSLRNSSNGLLNVVEPINKNEVLNQSTADLFEKTLEQLIQIIYNPDNEFVHNESSRYCDYC